MKRIFLIGFLIIITKSLLAQYYETGVEPFATKWRQITDGDIRVIYPSDNELYANIYLNLLKTTDSLVGKDFSVTKSKIDVVLHNHSVLSNGFVAWAPRRMELITHPTYDGYAQPWIKQLSTHEMRHVKQMYSLNRNFVKFTSYIFGQQATGLAAGFVPLWFLEGDAVATETSFSFSGRGRTASFFQQYRAHYLKFEKTFSYDKWLLGSYKDFIPNHYNFGYQIVTYGNLKYGSNIWNNTLDYVTRKPFTIFPFYFGLKKTIGLSRKQLASNAFQYQDSIWTNNAKAQSYTVKSQIIPDSKDYTNYEYPYQVNDSTIIAYKTSIKDIASFNEIDINTSKEKIIIRPGSLLGKPYINDSLIIWSEYKPHIRWEYKNFGQVVKYNYKTKQKTLYINKGMLGSPTYRSSDKSVYCLEYMPNGNFRLVSLTSSNSSIEILNFSNNKEPFELLIDNKTDQLFVGITTNKGKEIREVSPDYTTKLILGPTYLDINSIQVQDSLIVFAATNNYTENIYIHNIQKNSTFELINSKFGSNYPSFSQKKSILFSNYSCSGYKISKLDSIKQNLLFNINTIANDEFTTYLTGKASVNIDTLKIAETTYKSKPYTGIGSIFNFHSWAPFYFNPYNTEAEGTSVNLGATAMSQNLTGNTVFVLGYGYGNSHMFRANLRYYGFWPVFSLSYELFDTYATLYEVKNANYATNTRRNKIKLYTYLPLTLSNNNINTYLQLFSSIERTNDYLFEESDYKYRSGLFQMKNGIYFHILRQLSHRDLLPKYGITFIAQRVEAPYNKNNIGSLNALNTTLYLPGFIWNHHIKLTGSFQKQHLVNYYLSNKVNPPRGYSLFGSEIFHGFTADYLFPLAYPDCAIGSLLYIKRFSVDLFYDKAINSYPSVDKYTLQSVGFEINIDFHLFRTRYPFRLKYQQAFIGNLYSSYNNVSLTYDIYGGSGMWKKETEH
ncbi:MAG: hypothetical protein AB7S48_10870 [Bacteroidales bacterium]